MSNYYQILCPNCTTSNDITESICTTCGNNLPGTINTRRASIEEEKKELEKRYSAAKQYLANHGLINEGLDLENEVIANGKAVLNTQFHFLFDWLCKSSFQYESYRRQLIKGARMKAKFENDVNRTTADSVLFGSTIDIIYAALSIDEVGLISYGEITVILNKKSLIPRTSALEKNSFLFLNEISQNGWVWNSPLPCGFMAVWADFFKLSIAKIFLNLTNGITKEKLARLILNSDGDRSTDAFIELYIYGKIISSVIDKIKIPTTLIATFSPKENAMFRELQKKYKVELY